MATRFHAEGPEDPSRCTCGYVYPKYCRGGHPILRAETSEAITRKAAAGVPFTRIAQEVGESLHTVRRVIHR